MYKYDYPVHPLADVFPMLPEEDLQGLAQDIAENGLRHPIVLIGDGVIVDGRNRLAACKLLGLPPKYEHRADLNNEAKVRAFIASVNLHRRHLTVDQRAALAAELATSKVGGNGSNQHRAKPSNDGIAPGVTVEEAAELLNVGTATVERAKRRMRDNPEAHEKAKRGEAVRKPKTPPKAKIEPKVEVVEPKVEPAEGAASANWAGLLAQLRTMIYEMAVPRDPRLNAVESLLRQLA